MRSGRLGRLPSQVKVEHGWRTRPDPFAQAWQELRSALALNPGLEAQTLFLDLRQPTRGRFPDGQLRALQRPMRVWRALEDPPKEFEG